MSMSKQTPIALYQQVAEELKNQILKGDLEIGERIGSQEALGKRFDVSKITIRKAIELLEQDDLVTTIHGKGTYVKKNKLEEKLDRLKSLNDVIKMSGFEPEVEIINIEERNLLIAPDRNTNQRKSLPTIYLERLHSIDNLPVAYAQVYIPLEYGSKLNKEELERNTIYELLSIKFNIEVYNADQTIDAISSSADLSKILKIPIGTPLLRAKRITFSVEEELLEEIVIYYKHDTFAFKIELDQYSIIHKDSNSV